MKAKLQSNIELYSLGHFYHLNEIKINFLKGQKYFIAYLLTKVQMLPLKLKKKRERVFILRIMPNMSTFSSDFNSSKTSPHCENHHQDEAGRIYNPIFFLKDSFPWEVGEMDRCQSKVTNFQY